MTTLQQKFWPFIFQIILPGQFYAANSCHTPGAHVWWHLFYICVTTTTASVTRYKKQMSGWQALPDHRWVLLADDRATASAASRQARARTAVVWRPPSRSTVPPRTLARCWASAGADAHSDWTPPARSHPDDFLTMQDTAHYQDITLNLHAKYSIQYWTESSRYDCIQPLCLVST